MIGSTSSAWIRAEERPHVQGEEWGERDSRVPEVPYTEKRGAPTVCLSKNRLEWVEMLSVYSGIGDRGVSIAVR